MDKNKSQWHFYQSEFHRKRAKQVRQEFGYRSKQYRWHLSQKRWHLKNINLTSIVNLTLEKYTPQLMRSVQNYNALLSRMKA